MLQKDRRSLFLIVSEAAFRKGDFASASGGTKSERLIGIYYLGYGSPHAAMQGAFGETAR